MGKPRKHKRKGPKNTRAGCLMCKPYKVNGVVDKRFTEPPTTSKVHKIAASKPKKEYYVEIVYGVKKRAFKKRFSKETAALNSFDHAVEEAQRTTWTGWSADYVRQWGTQAVYCYHNETLLRKWVMENDL